MFRGILFWGVLAGCVLHAYTCFIASNAGLDAFTLGLFALSVLPYLVCLFVGARSGRGSVMAACAMPLLLLMDISVFHEAIIAPTTSTSSLALLVVPLLNLAVLPLGFVVGWIAHEVLRRRARSSAR